VQHLAPFSKATFPSLILCLCLAYCILLKLTAASNAGGVLHHLANEFRSNDDSVWRMDTHTALYLYSVNFLKLNFLMYDASFVLYSVLLSDVVGVTLQLFLFFLYGPCKFCVL